jgi:hypothetical protein
MLLCFVLTRGREDTGKKGTPGDRLADWGGEGMDDRGWTGLGERLAGNCVLFCTLKFCPEHTYPFAKA